MPSGPDTPDGPPSPSAHRPQVDGLRFLAFFAVYVHHVWPEAYPWGGSGVQFFFALSGFLITRILVRGESGSIGRDLKRYYVRRTLRIFPLYYALVLYVALTSGVADLGYFLTYTYNIRVYLTRDWDSTLSHFWTLCVEEQFYLLYPLALLFTPARRRFALVAGLIAAAKGFQIYAHDQMRLPWARLLLPFCGEDLLWGALAGLVDLRAARRRFEGPACFVAGLPLLVLAWTLPGAGGPSARLLPELASTSLLGIGSALVVFGAWRSESRWIVGPLAFAPMAYLGRISYGLYAFHLPVLRGGWLESVPYAFMVPRSWGGLAMTIALAAASWHFFEGPINRLKDRMPLRRTAA